MSTRQRGRVAYYSTFATFVKTEGGNVVVPYRNIDFIEQAAEGVAMIHLCSGKVIEVLLDVHIGVATCIEQAMKGVEASHAHPCIPGV